MLAIKDQIMASTRRLLRLSTLTLAASTVIAVLCGGRATPAKDIYINEHGSFAVIADIWQWTRSRQATVEQGEPVFIQSWLRYPDRPQSEVGLDGPTLAESSIEVLVGNTDPTPDGVEWAPARGLPPEASRGGLPPGLRADGTPKPVAMLRRPPGRETRRHLILAVWFMPDDGDETRGPARKASGAAGDDGREARRLVFDRLGFQEIWVRFPRLLIPSGTVADTLWGWCAGTSPNSGGVVVREATPPVARFAADVAAVISTDLIVLPEHRAMLEKHAAADPAHRVARWAEWLLLRSFVADPAWRAKLAERDPDALATFKKHEPAARRFLAEQHWTQTPPWYEAKLFIAA